MAGETHPDLVLMDILLEGDIDGIEATKQIRKLYNIPVIYLTGYNDKPTLEKANITKPNGYILKPYQISGIQKTIKITLINTPSIQAIPNNNIL